MASHQMTSPGISAPTDWRTRAAAWLPWAVVASSALVVTFTFIATDNTPHSAVPAYPGHQLDQPIAAWIFNDLYPVLWFALLAATVIHTVRHRKFSTPALLFLGGTTMFWIEWPADWGSYLVYNRNSALFTGWTSTWYQTYWKPVNVVYGYGIFFGIESLILLYVVPRVKAVLARVFPRASATSLLVASCVMLFYVADIFGERLMTMAGWYSYVEPVGPAWTSGHGSISLVWPAIPFLLFAVAISLWLRADREGVYPNERFFRVNTLAPGWTREFARLAVWIASMNAAIFVAQPLILVIGRILFLHNSTYVP